MTSKLHEYQNHLHILCYNHNGVFYSRGIAMNIAFVNDKIEESEEMLQMINEYKHEKNLFFTVDFFRSGEKFLEHFTVSKYAIIFMDVYMEGIDGVETCRRIRRIDSKCIIIFLTISGDFMPEAFSCHAFDYIQKPPSRERIYKVLTDTLQVLPQTFRTLEFSFNRRIIKLLYSDILCITANKHNTDITDRNGNTFSPHKPFSDIILPLEKDNRFLQINRGILVNMYYILNFDERSCHLIRDISLPVRVRERIQIEKQWQDYMFSQIHADFQKGISTYDTDAK